MGGSRQRRAGHGVCEFHVLAALEHRAEGLVLGVGASMFKLAGSVIVFGTVAAFIIGIIYAIFGIEGGNER